MTNLVCLILGHRLSNGFTQPDPPFQRRWSALLNESVWYEVFDHRCERCGALFRIWRWTRAARRRMLDDV